LRSKIEMKIDWHCSRGSSCCGSWARGLVPCYSKVLVRHFAVALVSIEVLEVVAELVAHEVAAHEVVAELVANEALNSGSAQWLHFVAAAAQWLGAHFVVVTAAALVVAGAPPHFAVELVVAEAPQHFAIELVVSEAPQHFAVGLVVAEAPQHFEVLRFQSAVRDLLETSHSMHFLLEP